MNYIRRINKFSWLIINAVDNDVFKFPGPINFSLVELITCAFQKLYNNSQLDT